MKKIKYLLTIIILFIGISPVLADTNNNIVDFTKKGIITITLSDNNNNKVEGANIKIYKLADAYSENNNLAFSYHEDLETCKNNIDKNKLNEKTLECIHNSNVLTKESTSNSSGYVSFNNLDLGLYLIEQTNKVENFSQMNTFLVYMPQSEGNNWVYKVDATPKIDIIRLFDLSVKKEWNVISNSDTPDKVTVELLKNDKVIDTVILSEQNNWEHTWNQIEKSDEYSVREINIPNGYTPTYENKDNKFIITNSKELVQTGKMPWIINLLASTGLLFIIIGIIIEKKESNA